MNGSYTFLLLLVLNTEPVLAMENEPPITTATLSSAAAEEGGNEHDVAVVPLPDTQLFQPLLADPKANRFFVSVLDIDSTTLNTTIAAVGFGEHFGIVRQQTEQGNGWQVDVAGAVFAQFDLEADSSDLINADYVIGVPVSGRVDKWSGRVRIYHQSSHLGDEYLLRVHPERVNLSYESIEILLAYDFHKFRLYGGGEYLFSREPSDLAEGLVHGGIDWRNSQPSLIIGDLGAARWVAGLDVKRWQQQESATQYSAKAGLEFAPLPSAGINNRHWSMLLEYFDGPSPYGQFYHDNLRYWGVSIQLSL